MIYFDHNATTPVDDRVLEAMLPFFKLYYGNPSALYRHGRFVRSAIDSAREQIATLVDAQPSQLIFTSGGTEANNLALSTIPLGAKLAISAVEHPSVSEPAEFREGLGGALKRIAVDGDGIITQNAIDEMLRFRPHCISIMLANNETGVIQDLASISQSLREQDVIVHTDAVQALGKIPLSYTRLGVDMMTLSSHKIYGPKGCGILVANKKVNVKSILLGGRQEQGFRGGTENVPAIIGFGKAAELVTLELAQRVDYLQKLSKILEERLSTLSGLRIFAKNAERLPNTVQFGFEGIDGEMLVMKLDQKGVAVSSGSACASGGGKPSPVLAAMGVKADVAKSAIRISFGVNNTEAEILEFFDILQKLVTPDLR